MSRSSDTGEEWSPGAGQVPPGGGQVSSGAGQVPAGSGQLPPDGRPAAAAPTGASSDPVLAPAQQPRADGRPVEVHGVARAVELRQDSPRDVEVLSFRVDRHDSAGNRLPSVSVQFRAWSIGGQVSDGEEVVVTGRWEQGVLQARSIHNLTTDAQVHHRTVRHAASDMLRSGPGIIGTVALLVVVVAVIAVVVLLFTAKGPAETEHTVPNVVGKTVQDAQTELARAQVGLGNVQGNPFCRVVRQSPAGGSTVVGSPGITLVTARTGNDPPGCR